MKYLTIYAAVISTWLAFRATYGWIRYRLMLRRDLGLIDKTIGDAYMGAFREFLTGVASEEPYKATLKSVSIVAGDPPPATAVFTPDKEA